MTDTKDGVDMIDEMVGGAYPAESLSLMENEGPTSPSVLSEPRGPSAIDEQSLMIAELAEASQEEEELRRRNQELENRLQQISSEVVQGTVVVDNRKGTRLWIGAALALLLVVGVILGVTIPLTTNNDKDSPSNDSVVTPAPTQAPTAAPTACTSLDCLAEILLQNEVSDAEALRDDSSPQFLALRWLANNDTMVLDLDSTPTVILVERYILAVLYFATSAEGGLNVLNFLSASSVCEWNNRQTQGHDSITGLLCNEDSFTGAVCNEDSFIGALCNEDDLVVALLLSGKSNHEEVIVLISKFLICARVNVTLRSHFLAILFGQILIKCRVPFRANSENLHC